MGNDTQETLLSYLSQALSTRLILAFDNGMPKPGNELQEKLLELLHQINEANAFWMQLASGNLHCTVPKNNELLGPAKDLQATLRHLLWQLDRIAAGDYSQKVEFLGDFSIAFNLYIEQVALREQYQAETARLEQQRLEQINAMLTQQLEAQLTYYDTLQNMHRKVRGMKHDMKNHCFALNALINAENAEGAQQYLHSMCSTLMSAKENTYNTGNPIFDALLTEKVGKAQARGIEINVELGVKPDLSVDNMDWCILLGNALDNAIESCEILKKGSTMITVKIILHKDTLGISIRNSAQEPTLRADGGYDSSKQTPSIHGLGLLNISQVVRKYGGILQTKFKNGYFSLTCTLRNI